VKTVQVELTDATARAASEAGLLAPEAMERLLRDALRRREAAAFLAGIADRVAEAGPAAMTQEEIRSEVKASRAERRAGASRR